MLWGLAASPKPDGPSESEDLALGSAFLSLLCFSSSTQLPLATIAATVLGSGNTDGPQNISEIFIFCNFVYYIFSPIYNGNRGHDWEVTCFLFRFCLLKLWDIVLLHGFVQSLFSSSEKHTAVLMNVMLSLQLSCLPQLFNYPVISKSSLLHFFISVLAKRSASSCFSITQSTCPQNSSVGPGPVRALNQVQADLRLIWKVKPRLRKAAPHGTKPRPNTDKDPKLGSSWAECGHFWSKREVPKAVIHLPLLHWFFQMTCAFLQQLCYMNSSGLRQ